MPINIKRNPPSATFHITFSVNDSFANKVEMISSEIFKHYNSDFQIGEKYAAHITLYLFSAPLRNVTRMKVAALSLVESMRPKIINLGQLILSDDGWLMINLEKSEEIIKYHHQTIKLFNKYREGLLRKKYRNKKYFNKQSKEGQETLSKYGDKHSMNLYHPHISIAHFPNMDIAKEVYVKYKNFFISDKLTITNLELVRAIGDETGGIGNVLFRYNFRT